MNSELMRVSATRSQSGSILFVTLILAILLGITLSSYLYWVRTQNVLVAESQAWNTALVIAEAGIEEGMAQVNVNEGSANPLDFSASIRADHGATPTLTWPNPLGYDVTVSNDSPPTIYSSGTTAVPLVGRDVTRTVMVTTKTNFLFGVAIAALQDITMNGNNIYVDAYDSADLVHFPNGLYNTNYAFAKGDVASTGGILSVGNGDIHGRIFLAPNAGYTIGPNGLVGDMPANWPAQSGVESPISNWVINDFNKDFPDVIAPFASGLSPSSGIGSTQWQLTGGNYFVAGNFQVNNNKTLAVSGVNVLYVQGSFTALQNSIIDIAPGASLKVFVGQASGTPVTASFGQVNNAGNAATFQVFGLPTLTGSQSLTLGGNGQYVGTIYAPEAQLYFNGGGVNALDFQGGIVIGSANLNGHFNIHYDVNLSRAGPIAGYTLASWKEL